MKSATYCLAFLLICHLAATNTATSSAADESSKSLESLAWMTGSWSHQEGDRQTEEHWIAPKGGLMLGVNRMVRGDRSSFEFLRIARTTEGISYFASPQGRPPTEFKLTTMEGKRVVFENPEHDFPQRITYWLDDEGHLHGSIEGVVNKVIRKSEWRWQKVK